MISRYAGVSPKGDLILLKRLGDKMGGKSFLHVNSTKAGGGVAEILHRMMPILQGLGIRARWEVIEGDEQFFDITKKIHNALQGNREIITKKMWQHHFDVNEKNMATIQLDEVDAALIHDPQPAPLIEFKKSGKWIWRCHIDVSNPMKEVRDHLFQYCKKYDAAVFSVARFAKAMGVDEFIIPPSIDPLSDKNRDLTEEEVRETAEKLSLPLDRPIILQVSRFDRFKDPTGVIEAYRMVKRYNDCVLVLAGSPATDDPEGAAVLALVKEFASSDPDIHILLLPPFSDKDINALQRMATVVLQKSLKEGFGLTVTEAMWKGKPVIGGAVGGIPLQVIHGVTGFLVHSVEGAAFRIRQFLNNPEMAKRMGERGKEHIRQHFLITRQIRDYLSIWYTLERGEDGTSGLSI
ncbi:MAG TPA: glycosyltransferase [Syntrophorhabdus sp.]|jgi:trehalose synthase|nr:glycosyltransferase [Syntrophorhabdus sp.]OQB78139.1 MAG: Trehalose synthase [Deltaproteobacteria bacterium ADurb.Bin135]HOD77685.1 glycosyltransferase [Syntrophorhabdus sp.]HQG24388.1 glycosyltransferase [Syntrophorhabdus sp.]HQH81431.1 glycosyltransferase [Syntrophorhabdus sp.]